MGKLDFRDLRADEIDCRVATVSEKGITVLLYKDARCDMNILDETVGAFNWKKSYELIDGQLFCTVSIYDEDKKEWIGKQDVGVESNTEAEKGRASDAQKRSAFAWGIGRELYTAPFIWISAENCKIVKRNDGKFTCYDKFSVKEITIKDKKITGLSIVNASTRKIAYRMGEATKPAPSDNRTALRTFCENNGIDKGMIVQTCGLNKDSTDDDYAIALTYAKNLIGGQA